MTLKSFFKSKNAKDADMIQLEKQIRARTKEIENTRKLIDFITVY